MQENAKQEKKNKQIKIVAITLAVIWALIVVIILSFFGVRYFSTSKKYNEAEELFDQGNFTQAEEIYEQLGNFKDSSAMITECEYQQAEYFFSLHDYVQSGEIYNKLGDYKDCKDKALQCTEGLNESNYNKAMTFLNENNYPAARDVFESLGDYKDSAQRIKNIDLELKYRDAVSKYNAGQYDEALTVLNEMKDYKEAGSYIKKIKKQNDIKNYKKAYLDYITGLVRYNESDNGESVLGFYYLIDFDNNGIQELILYRYREGTDASGLDFFTFEEGKIKQIYEQGDRLLFYSSKDGKQYYALWLPLGASEELYTVNYSTAHFSLDYEATLPFDEPYNGYTDFVNNYHPGAKLIKEYDAYDLSPLQ